VVCGPTWRRLQLRADHVTALLASYSRIAQCDGYAADKHSVDARWRSGDTRPATRYLIFVEAAQVCRGDLGKR
jgi:hypothetical protein